MPTPPLPLRVCLTGSRKTACWRCSPTTPLTGFTAATAWSCALSSAVRRARSTTSSPSLPPYHRANVTFRERTMPDQPTPPHDRAPAIRGLSSQYATVGGSRLHYWIGGPEADVLVVLWHGFLGTGWAWREVAADLVGAGLGVLVVDLLGFGDSDKPSGTDGYDARAMSEQVRSLAALAAPGSTKCLLVAHDMGAPPALLWAAGHPGEVHALTYIEAPVMTGDLLRP